MFHHVKELQFNARVSGPDPKFAGLLLEQFGGPNGELKAAMTYFIQAFGCRKTFPDKYDLLMDIATEEFSHLEIVGATIQMLLEGVNGELKNASEKSDLNLLLEGKGAKEQYIHEALTMNQFQVLTGGGPALTNSQGVPFSGAYVDANGDLTVDLRSDIAAESRAKIVYEYLMQFTDDPYVKESLAFLMTREIAHFQMFQAALETVQPNFPPGVLQGDPRFTNVYYNMSNGADVSGPWNQGQPPLTPDKQWEYIQDPIAQTIETNGNTTKEPSGGALTLEDATELDKKMSKIKSAEIISKTVTKENQWSSYPQDSLENGNGKQSNSDALAVETKHGAVVLKLSKS